MYGSAIILGIVEGLTEFLPVSSTAHLLIVSQYLPIVQNEYWKFFTVFIQAGAILAVFTVFLSELRDARHMRSIITAWIPTMIIGFLLYSVIKNVFFESKALITITLIAMGIVFLVIELLVRHGIVRKKHSLEEMSSRHAFILGLVQAIAVIPGVSRAGAVIVGGMGLGYSRKDATLFSFLLAVPTILAAAGYDFLKTDPSVVFQNIGVTLVGFATAFITAYIVIRWFIRYVQFGTLIPFALYRFILAAFLIFMS